MIPDELEKTPSPSPRKLLPVKIAARRLHCVPDYVSRLCRQHQLDGVLIGRTWFVDEQSLHQFEQTRVVQKATRSRELSQQRRAEEAALRRNKTTRFIHTSLVILALAVAGGTLLALRLYRIARK